MYYIETYDTDTGSWEDCFGMEDNEFTKEEAEYQVECMREVDNMNNESYQYRIMEV